MSLIDLAKNTIFGKSKRKKKNNTPQKVKEFSLAKMPPCGHDKVPDFFGELYEKGLDEIDRQNMHQRWFANYILCRGKQNIGLVSSVTSILKNNVSSNLSMGLIGANVERTVANITARAPVSSVQSATGDDGLSSIMTSMVEAWNSAEYQHESLALSCRFQEVYGTCIEKETYDDSINSLRPVPLDITAFVPCPGKYHDIQEMPYCCHQYMIDVSYIEEMYGIEGITETADLDKTFLGTREDVIVHSNMIGSGTASIAVPGGAGSGVRGRSTSDKEGLYENKVLVVEIWCHDRSRDDAGVLVYPGGIRVVVLAKVDSGYVLLADMPNPNVNWGLTKEQVKETYAAANYPFVVTRSYLDDNSFWGFSQAETSGEIALAIDEVWRMLIKYIKICLLPPVIIPKDTGIDKSQFAYCERLVLQPNSMQTSQGIRFMPIPSPPSWLFQVLDILMMFFGRVAQIEDVDRGDAPTGIIAASAIQMLQERAAVLVRAKIRAIDSLVTARGRWFISMKQNFGIEPEWVNVAGTAVQASGIDFLRENFVYMVESGSTIIKTEAEEREAAIQLFQIGAIDQRAVLEAVKFRGYRDVLERMAEGDVLDRAAQIFVQAGIPVEVIQQLIEFARQQQGMPGDDPLRGKSAMQSGGNSMAQNGQPMAAGRGGGQGGSQAGEMTMRGKAPQIQNGGAPAKAGVPMAKQNG